MRPGVGGLNLAGLQMQPGRATMSLRFLAVDPSEVRVGRCRGLLLGHSLVLQRPRCTLSRPLLTFERCLVHAPVAHARNILP